jgi:hypothetical protein
MRYLSLLTKLLDLILFAVQRWRNQKLRQEGRKEVAQEHQEQTKENLKDAQEIDLMVADADIDTLRERMSKYQRPTE